MEPVRVNDPQQIEMFPTVLRLRRTDPEGAVRRFYLVTVQPDLFGGAALVAESGHVGSPGSTTTRFFPDEGLAVDALSEVAKRKSKQGYVCFNHPEMSPAAQSRNVTKSAGGSKA